MARPDLFVITEFDCKFIEDYLIKHNKIAFKNAVLQQIDIFQAGINNFLVV
jgi:hypothetical protein